MNTAVVVFRKGDLRYSLCVRLGLVFKVGLFTPKRYEGKELKEVGNDLISRGFVLTKILK